ncbi:MAG: hypothetical protein V7L04_11670 [Nostoc sp.]|uniref:hypothetical protein n=1 Tax=Nostoc sp. TaxID=1180 RepID=UPI002FFC4616
MLKENANIRIKIFRSIFAALNLALISGGLVSCVLEVPQPVTPTEQQKPVLQPNQVKQNDKNGDRKNDKNDGKHDDRKNDKNDDDKEDND